MTDDQFDEPFDPGADAHFEALMRDAARTYNRPPEPRADALWAAIEAAVPHGVPERPALTVVPRTPRTRRAAVFASPWLRAAAVLLLGVAIGRTSVRPESPTTARVVATVPDDRDPGMPADAPVDDPDATGQYLGRIETLLAGLPNELEARRSDPAYLSRADALLLETRLLLDSPAATDPALRSLFDDLEIVLAQVVRLQASRDPMRIDFLNQALEQRDVLPRLRDAVADNAVADNAGD